MRALVALIFFLSGASALVFESLWFRLAGLSLGNSVWSASLVLAAFMGGLAIGNGLVARFHERIVRPVRVYAALELAIGVGGMAVVLLLPQFSGILGSLLGGLTESPVLLNTVRLTIAFTVLMIPAIAMGATLPVLAQALSRQYENFGANIGWLYGWNTFGAMAGAFSAELFLVPMFGITSSGLFALLLNLIAVTIALRYSASSETVTHPTPSESALGQKITVTVRRYIAVAFLSGASMLALEIIWFRFLLLTHDGTSLIFAAMLAIVLAGIAAGGLAAAYVFQRDERAYRWLRHVTAVSAMLVVLTYWGYDLFSTYRDQNTTSTFMFVVFASFLMFPTAFLSGVAFTMVNRAVKDSLGSSARTAGIATLYNTIGSMLGSLVAGFILLPVFGMELSFFTIAATYCAIAFVVPRDEFQSRTTNVWGHGTIAAAAISLFVFPFGLMHSSYLNVRASLLPDHTLLTTREGLTETIRYYSHDVFGEPHYYRLVTNGHSMSATQTDAKRYMKLYVYLPLALNPDTKNALLISFGVGSTAKALADTKSLTSIDVVDISRDILELSEIVHPGEENPLNDERVEVHVEDGRFFLNTTTEYYDLITSEPPPPKNAGIVNLYTQEYFELIHSRLSPGGYTSYWLPVDQLNVSDTLSIIKGFCNAFSDCSLWSGAGLNWMLLGSRGATSRIDAAEFSAQWRDPAVGRELIELGLESPAQLGSLFMADADLLSRLTADILPVTDNYPSRISSELVFNDKFVETYDLLMDEDARRERFSNSSMINNQWPLEIVKQADPYFAYERLIKDRFTGGIYRRDSDPYQWASIDDLLSHSSLTTLPLWLLGSEYDTQAIVARQLEQDGYRTEFALELARKHTAERDFETALMYLHDHQRNSKGLTPSASTLLVYLLLNNGFVDQARITADQLRSVGRPDLDQFVEWFDGKLDEESSARPSQE